MGANPSSNHVRDLGIRALYVRILLRILPLLLSLFRHMSKKIQTEIDYLEPGYTFMVTVAGTNLAGTCRRGESGSFKRVPPACIARDVEAGSGLPSGTAGAVAVDYVIEFRSLAFAFDCFIGTTTLKAALAERAFSTRGPNDAGVALVYMFTALLRMFFGWRAAYRALPQPKAA